MSGWHTVVCVCHDECLSRYAHCENIQVREGQRVAMGEYIANVGNAGGRYPY
ncbi:MAG: peptidoglycan DD-metalloendopeptidase family protein, partial [Burkholderiales bacterium]|nr:peptidoglycan DD-metalloendopeptidase family protein [Burkholderiales bacterium]